MIYTPVSLPPTLSVVVPLFNEEDIISELVERLVNACASCVEDYEIIVVNDGSTDDTLLLLREEFQRHPRIVVADLSRNYGHMAALSAGLRLASGQAVVVMDGDLQDPPELIPGLVAKWRSGADVVLAQRTARSESAVQRGLTSLYYRLMAAIADVPTHRQVGTFCLLTRRAVDQINSLPERVRCFASLRAWIGFSTDWVYYQRPPRKNGKSRVSFGGLFGLARASIVSFSKLPLVWVSRFSLAASAALLLFGFAVILIKVCTRLAIPGWASTMVMVGGVGALQSAVMAVLCEYIAVLFDEAKNRPGFVINQVFRSAAAEEPAATPVKRMSENPAGSALIRPMRNPGPTTKTPFPG